MSFRNTVAVVTGGESGIGAATCRQLAGKGANVVVCGVNDDAGERVAEGIRSTGGVAVFVHVDVREADSVNALCERANSEFGTPGILVNCAGVALVKSITETTVEEFDNVIAINLRSIMLTAHAFLPAMIREGKGVVVNVASQLGIVAAPKFAVYSASKAAVINLSRAMALDYAEHGVRVNAVCPGAVETPLLLNQFDGTEGPQGTIDDLRRMHPLGRLGKPDEIASAIVFLAGDECSFVTGSPFIVDGGYTAW